MHANRAIVGARMKQETERNTRHVFSENIFPFFLKAKWPLRNTGHERVTEKERNSETNMMMKKLLEYAGCLKFGVCVLVEFLFAWHGRYFVG